MQDHKNNRDWSDWSSAWLDAACGLTIHRHIWGCRQVSAQWYVGPRRLEEQLIYLIVEGGCQGEVAGHPVRLSAGDLFWLMPGLDHRLALLPGLEGMRLYHLRLNLVRDGLDVPAPVAMIQLQQCQSMREIWDRLMDDLHLPDAHSPVLQRSLLSQMAVQVARRMTQADSQSGRTLNVGQCRLIRQYVLDHPARRPSPGDLAQLVRLSPDYFSRLFRATFGQSPRHWLVRRRIDESQRLLTDTTLSIGEIADQLGYENLFLFSRQFKQVVGVAPSQWRRQGSRILG